MGVDVSALDVGPIAAGKRRFDFVAMVGWDNVARILSLKPGETLAELSMQALQDSAESGAR